jgi:hypothetical protein
MDRLPDVRKTAPSPRPETSERKPRESTRATRTRSSDKSAENTRATDKTGDRQRTERPDAKPKEHRFEVQQQKSDGKPATQTDAQGPGTTKPEQDVAELIAQQPALRAQAVRLDPVVSTKPAEKVASAEAAPISLPAQLEAVALANEAADERPIELKVDARPAAQAALQTATVETKTERAVETPRETSETRQPQDLERAADILRQVRVHLAPRDGEAHIELQPRELGRISIHVTVADGKMRTEVRAEKREALDAIQAHLPELRATLRDSGIVTQDFQFSLGLQNQPRREQPGSQDQNHSSNAPAIDARDPEHAVLLRATASASGVDLFA